MQRTQRLKRELERLTKVPPQGICVLVQDSNDKFEAQITGPDNTPYSEGVFKLEIIIPDNYPFVPPSIKFLTKVYHPNIDDHGRICLDLIKMPPKGSWKPTLGLEGLLIAVRMLLETPNPDDPLMVEVATEFKSHNDLFEKKARSYTQKYATSQPIQAP